ncbi:MAG: AmmeMemoRadiSam system radical SAM enzyme [Candidatus Bathyarchaeia archaeon]
MREAMLYERLEGNAVKCNLCGRRCMIKNGESGFCLVRKNLGGVLYSLVYAKAVSACVDPIEKKPLFHFHPGALVMSIATVGCNFRCQFCDNWMISQEKEISGKDFPPEDVVRAANDNGCQGITYTYTEPTIFFEYAYETAKLAHKVGFFNTFVTNGYMTPEAVRAIAPYLDAATVDFKGGADESFYRTYSKVPAVEPIFECLKELKRNNVHIEITNLVIPKIGDSIEKIRELAEWICESLGADTPFHLLRFHPDYKLTTIPSTPIDTLEKAYAAAKSAGLHFVYIGNVPGHPAENTYCPNCNELLIKRYGFAITRWNLTKNMQCPVCGSNIPIKGQLHPGGSGYPYALF